MNQLRDLTRADVTFTLEIEDEDHAPDFQSGDPAYKDADDALERECRERLDRGDTWAWCGVIVTAKWGTYVGRASVWGCSYLDEKEFRECCEAAALEADALYDLNRQLAEAYTELSPLIIREVAQ